MAVIHLPAAEVIERSQRRSTGALTRRLVPRLVGLATSASVGLAALAFLALGVGPHLLHYRTMTMLTGSMSPTIRPGAVIVDTSEPASDLRIGQVVTYHIPVLDHHVESHRVVYIARNGPKMISFETKGDANQARDPWVATVKDDATMWRVRGLVPVAGTAIRALREPGIGGPLRWGGILAAVVIALLVVWERPGGQGDAGATREPE